MSGYDSQIPFPNPELTWPDIGHRNSISWSTTIPAWLSTDELQIQKRNVLCYSRRWTRRILVSCMFQVEEVEIIMQEVCRGQTR